MCLRKKFVKFLEGIHQGLNWAIILRIIGDFWEFSGIFENIGNYHDARWRTATHLNMRPYHHKRTDQLKMVRETQKNSTQNKDFITCKKKSKTTKTVPHCFIPQKRKHQKNFQKPTQECVNIKI